MKSTKASWSWLKSNPCGTRPQENGIPDHGNHAGHWGVTVSKFADDDDTPEHTRTQWVRFRSVVTFGLSVSITIIGYDRGDTNILIIETQSHCVLVLAEGRGEWKIFLPIMNIARVTTERSIQVTQYGNIAVACVSQWERIVSRL